MAMYPTRPSTTPYFYGRISRDEAENVLKGKGCQQGLYLLRESLSQAGNYALSICHQDRIHHYSIERQSDGTVMIQDGKRFAGPVELISHHSIQLDGFLTMPSIPCMRSDSTVPMAFPGVTMMELEYLLLQKAESMGLENEQLENVFGPQRHHFVACVAKELHREMPWFFGRISRDEADKAMTKDRHKDGKFLVRERDNITFALSLSFRNQTKHYKIEKHRSSSGEKLAIEDGPRFDSLMDMVAHYHNKTDGLLCKLTQGCTRRGYKKSFQNKAMEFNRGYDAIPADQSRSPLVATGGHHWQQNPAHFLSNIMQMPWEEPDFPDVEAPTPRSRTLTVLSDEDSQKIYDSVPRTEDVFNLHRGDLELHEKLGAGNFGSVMKGVFRRGGQLIPVAVKTLKQDELPNAESELMKEARLMANLQHRNIVRMIGVCRSDMIMLVLELAPLGPLNKYLKRPCGRELTINKVLEIMFQVAEGMAYLESKNFVHRDLAARNVLLVNEQFAKISDFGMSKALGLGNEYYKAESAGKWPLKWYAPECIYYFKFDSKSDVWSYGVTLWEGMSYGAKPYRGLKGCQILELIENDRRLEKPDLCPPGVFDVMLRCWRHDKKDRPSFREIVELLRKFRSSVKS